MIWTAFPPRLVELGERAGLTPVASAHVAGRTYAVVIFDRDPTHYRAAFGDEEAGSFLKILFRTAEEAEAHLELIAEGFKCGSA
jgi:hypothetical protein